MSVIPDNTRVTELVMPGSHDAGVASCNVELNFGVIKSWAVCQYGELYKQALWGSRFFDCRVFYQAQTSDLSEMELIQQKLGKKDARGDFQSYQDRADWVRLHPGIPTEQLRFGHFARERADNSGHGGLGGGYGGALKGSIEEAITFLTEHPNEFLIMRFSHSGWPGKLCEVMKYWYEKYKLTKNWQDYIYRTPGNIATEFVGNLRGKLVMVFDGKHTALDPTVGLHLFSKYEDLGGGVPNGLTTCGIYAASSDMAVVRDAAKEALNAHYKNHGSDHLHFVYFQQTMSLASIKAATTAPNTTAKRKFADGTKKMAEEIYSGGAHANMPHLVGQVRATASKFGGDASRYVNIVSHDFVNPTTCRHIISLNPVWANLVP